LCHAPPDGDAPRQRCAHLEALAEAATGVPLGPAAELVAAGRSRGRHGNALQWHFGLEPHDGLPVLDWEDRIEIKLVSVWARTAGGGLATDKVKVCDVAIDPWRKLSNVLWVFADRLTRVVIGHRFWRLAGAARERLARSFDMDPHFDRPDLFVEAREHEGRSAPAYYLSARWFESEKILPASGALPFDAKWWGEARAASGGRDPLVCVVRQPFRPTVECPRCNGTLHLSPHAVEEDGWAPARHGLPLGDACALRWHLVVDDGRLPSGTTGRGELVAALGGGQPSSRVARVCDLVLEPEDHLH
jgi:hypothetical protein